MARQPFVSVLVPAHQGAELLAANVPRLVSFFEARFRKRYEIILIPNPVLQDQATLTAARAMAERHPTVRVCVTSILPGKGLALKEGFGIARGSWIFTTDVDLPYDLSFFLEAERLLGMGFHLVTGNRRLPTSRFRIPAQVLPKVYPRVLMGLLFNLFVRLLFPIRTTDTQAGIKAMTRDTAREAFRRQLCPRYSYDIEMFLTVAGTGRKMVELPVVLHLPSEKSTLRILDSAFRAFYWILRIFLNHRMGNYSRALPA